MKKVFYLSFILFLMSLLIKCKDKNAEFSPGSGDPRLVGTWQLVERRYPIDSSYYLHDSTHVQAGYVIDSTFINGHYVKDSVFVNAHLVDDSLKVIKSVDSTRIYSAISPQTLTFGTDGKLTASGNEMTYYNPIKYFNVDKTYPDSLFINFFITTNRSTVPFQQGLSIKGDMLVLLPRCERLCYSKFTRVH